MGVEGWGKECKGVQEASGNTGCLHYLDVVLISQVYACVKMFRIVHFKHTQFVVYLLYLQESY